jgi:hypothetical protein
MAIVSAKEDKPHWGAREIRERPPRAHASDPQAGSRTAARPEQPAAASQVRRLSAGVASLELLDGLNIDTAPIRLLKASVDDPKHPGWPAGTPGGQGGKFRPNDGGGAPEPNVPAATPVADFSGGFHDAVVDSWMAYFATIGVPAVKNRAIRLVGSEGEVFGYPDIMANITQLGVSSSSRSRPEKTRH